MKQSLSCDANWGLWKPRSLSLPPICMESHLWFHSTRLPHSSALLMRQHFEIIMAQRKCVQDDRIYLILIVNVLIPNVFSSSSFLSRWTLFRYGRWVTRRIAVLSIVTIWLLAALVSFVPISFGLHRPDLPLVYEDNGRKYPTCALDLTPTYAVVSSCISFYVPCIVMIGIYCR